MRPPFQIKRIVLLVDFACRMIGKEYKRGKA